MQSDTDIIAVLPKVLTPFQDIPSCITYQLNLLSPQMAFYDCSRDICSVCGSGSGAAETQLMFCSGCGHGFHRFCIFPDISEEESISNMSKFYRSDWMCMNCTYCAECESESDPSNSNGTEASEDQYIFCDYCDRSYHMGCVVPALRVSPQTAWICKVGGDLG